MELNSFGSVALPLSFGHYYVFVLARNGQARRRSIGMRKKKEETRRKKFSSLAFKPLDGVLTRRPRPPPCVYSHLFVLSRFQAPHMDRCFPFHLSSDLKLSDGKLLFVHLSAFFSLFSLSLGPLDDYMAKCYDFIMLIQLSFM
jgi:hypothetical protein